VLTEADAPTDGEPSVESVARLRERVAELERHVRRAEERRRALLHIMGDLNESNKRLGDQRKAMLHILADYERDRSRLARQTERLDSSRRALLHILQDSHESNLRLANSRKAMIHIMGDLRETTTEMERREQELRDKQEQLVQAGKLATLGELTTGIAHELNNPLNNIGLFVGNAVDQIELGTVEDERVRADLDRAMEQVRKATEIISHLRTFGRAATVTFEPVSLKAVIERSLSLMHEQLRLRQIDVALDVDPNDVVVNGNSIQLEQVFINLLTNARDALIESPRKLISIECRRGDSAACVRVADTGGGIPPGLEQRIFDPFFTTKQVGTGTGLGLSITYGIIQEHRGAIWLENRPGEGATFVIDLPLSDEEQ
jgi:C4-dicarboxylate-specific signal transduction histidine kinase